MARISSHLSCLDIDFVDGISLKENEGYIPPLGKINVPTWDVFLLLLRFLDFRKTWHFKWENTVLLFCFCLAHFFLKLTTLLGLVMG